MTGKVANMSTYAQGFGGGLSVRGENLVSSHPGKIFWVADGDTVANTAAYPNRKGASDSGAGTFLSPFKTVDYAVGQTLANRGDIIMVLPGYVQDIAAANGVDLDVAGTSIIGVGAGANQPQFTFSNTASTFRMNAANCSLDNLRFTSALSAVVVGVDVADGSDDYRISDCRWDQGASATLEFIRGLIITTSDRGVVENNHFDSTTADGAVVAVEYKGACLGGKFRYNTILGAYTTACLDSITAAPQELVIHDNIFVNGQFSGLETVACVSMLTGTTGYLHDNQFYTNVASATSAAVAADSMFFGGGNWLQTSAEGTPIELEGGATDGGIIRSLTVIGTADDTATVDLMTVTGVIDVWGVKVTATTAFNSAATIAILSNAAATADDKTLAAATALTTATAVGDFAYPASPGATLTIRQVEAPTAADQLWAGPTRCIGGSIDGVAAGTPGTGVYATTVYYSAVSSNGALAAT